MHFHNRVLQLEEERQKRFPQLSRPGSCENQSIADRLRRSLSWLERAALAPRRDKPPRFIDLWIALNALYGAIPFPPPNERHLFQNFIRKLSRIDYNQEFLVPSMCQGNIQDLAFALVDDPHLWKEFWQRKVEELSKNQKAGRNVMRASLREKDAVGFYMCVFERLYLLRNQIFHGSSSATTIKSKDALKPAIEFLEKMVPTFICVMLRCGSARDWPSLPFPGIDTPQYPG